jgi:hypothetical protein
MNEPTAAGLFHAHLKCELEMADANDAFHPASWTLLRLTNNTDDSTLSNFCHLIRDIFGNPFRPILFDSSWLTSTATALAQQMYDSRDFSAMPILADALQDAGCDSADILNHCRQPGEHTRGCWVVDQVTGRS